MHGFVSRIDQELRSAAYWQGLIPRQQAGELFDFTTTTDTEIVRCKALNCRNTGYPANEAGPERLYTLTDGTYHPHPSNSDGVVRRPAGYPRRHRNCTTGQEPLLHSAATARLSVAAISPYDDAER